MGYPLSENDIAKQLIGVNFTGNIIPTSWFEVLRTKTEKPKPYLQAIIILSDVVFWYRPSIVRSEENPDEYWYEKKYKGELLQRNYKQYENMFGLSANQSRRACVYLEDMNLITRVFEDVTIKNGAVLPNVMFIHLHVERLIEVTFPGGYSKILEYPIVKFQNTVFKNLQGIQKEHNTEKTNTPLDFPFFEITESVANGNGNQPEDRETNPSLWSESRIEKFIRSACGLNVRVEIALLGDVKKTLIEYGVEKTKSGLKLSFDEWCKKESETTKKPYNPYNTGWVKWAVEYVRNGVKRWEAERSQPQEEEPAVNLNTLVQNRRKKHSG